LRGILFIVEKVNFDLNPKFERQISINKDRKSNLISKGKMRETKEGKNKQKTKIRNDIIHHNTGPVCALNQEKENEENAGKTLLYFLL